MRREIIDIQTSESALNWMLDHNMVQRSSTKDPETLATVRGFVLSIEMGERIGAHLVELLTKATKKRNGGLKRITVRDAFLTATIGAILEAGQVSLNEEGMMQCANIVLGLLPIGRLEKAGVARKQLRSLTRDKFLVGKILDVCSQAA